MWRCTLVLLLAQAALAQQEFPHGQVIDRVTCRKDLAQSYALFLPTGYSPDRAWPVIFAFDPRANGRAPVTQYQTAAERYGYIVAGSLNSHNGPWDEGVEAADAMMADVIARFHVDARRMYATGQSGGARLAMGMAIDSGKFAGVIASSAAWPGNEHPDSLPFVVFGTAGTEDFNNLEMHQFDSVLKSPHRLEIFEGGHQWLPSELAVEAVEWIEIQGMKTGIRPRDDKLIDRIFEARERQIESEGNSPAAYRNLTALVADFSGLKDVQPFARRAASIAEREDVRTALERERAREQRESGETAELYEMLEGLTDPVSRPGSIAKLKVRLPALARVANAAGDSSERRMARRELRGVIASSRSIRDPEYQTLLRQISNSK